jgi:CheY-like chemotaxis protein
MPGMNGIEATRIIHGELPDLSVIGLSTFEEGEQAASLVSSAFSVASIVLVWLTS